MRTVYPKDSVLIQVQIPKRIRDKVLKLSQERNITFAKAVEECLGTATENVEAATVEEVAA